MRAQLAEWTLVAVGLALAGLVFWTDREAPFRAGASTAVAITLVSSDAENLGCALQQEPFGYRCASPTARSPQAQVTDKRDLVPCMTLDRQLLLVPDLFGVPAVADRIASDRHNPAPTRFTVDCHVHVLGKVHGVRVRFRRNAPFGDPQSAWLVVPMGCSVAGDGA